MVKNGDQAGLPHWELGHRQAVHASRPTSAL